MSFMPTQKEKDAYRLTSSRFQGRIDLLEAENKALRQRVEDLTTRGGLYVILTMDSGMEETDPYRVFMARTFETADAALEFLSKYSIAPKLSHQIGQVIPLQGDPDF